MAELEEDGSVLVDEEDGAGADECRVVVVIPARPIIRDEVDRKSEGYRNGRNMPEAGEHLGGMFK